MDKLCVAGCSFSDRTQTTHCYGDFLSTYLNKEYLHLAGGCGSNPRSFRLITEALIDEQLTAGDTVIFQVTDTTRRELYSMWLTDTDRGKEFLQESESEFEQIRNALARKVAPQSPVKDANPHYDRVADDVYVTRFKIGSYEWQRNKYDTKTHQTVENLLVNPALDGYLLYLDMWKLAQLFNQRNIKLIVFWLYEEQKKEFLGKWLPQFDSIVPDQFVLTEHWPQYRGTTWWETNNVYALNPGEKDWAHFSVHGHIIVAEVLQKYMESMDA